MFVLQIVHLSDLHCVNVKVYVGLYFIAVMQFTIMMVMDEKCGGLLITANHNLKSQIS